MFDILTALTSYDCTLSQMLKKNYYWKYFVHEINTMQKLTIGYRNDDILQLLLKIRLKMSTARDLNIFTRIGNDMHDVMHLMVN